MELKRKVISLITLMVAVVMFSTFVAAQETTTTDDQNSVKKEGKKGRYGRRGKRGKRGGRGMRGRHGRKGRRGGNRLLKGITLNDSQKTQLQSLFQTQRAEMRKNFESRKKGQNSELRNLRMAKRSGLATAAQEKQLADMRAVRMAKSKAKRDQMNNSIRSILTAEQQTQFDKNLADGKKHMDERKKRFEERKKMRKERRNKRSEGSQEDG